MDSLLVVDGDVFLGPRIFCCVRLRVVVLF